jgi:hypothetical protein
MLCTITGLFSISAAAAEQSNEIYSERPFMCAAVFRILMEGHLNPDEGREHDRFKARFDALYKIGVQNVLRNGGTAEDTRAIMQKYIDTAGEFALKEKDKIGDLVLHCEHMYRKL